MVLLCAYFAAPDDEVAASVLAVEGGPAAAPAPGYETVELRNIEPVVTMQTLEEILTARWTQEVSPRQDNILALEPHGPAIVAITTDLQRALAAADEATLRRAAVSWAGTDELAGSDPDDLAGALRDLAALARNASARGYGLYCWLSL